MKLLLLIVLVFLSFSDCKYAKVAHSPIDLWYGIANPAQQKLTQPVKLSLDIKPNRVDFFIQMPDFLLHYLNPTGATLTISILKMEKIGTLCGIFRNPIVFIAQVFKNWFSPAVIDFDF
jgi:hypothetical protein